jgi:nucleoid DNA-binding protein
VLADPIADVIGESLVELLEVSGDDEPVVSDIATIPDREGIGLARLLFNRKIGKINGLIFNFYSIALHGDLSFERNLNHMRASLKGRDELAVRVRTALSLATKKEAEHVIDAVITSLETTLLNHLGTDGFTLKLNGFGKFSVRHRPGIRRKLGFTGETIQTRSRRKIRFISLGALRQRERVD